MVRSRSPSWLEKRYRNRTDLETLIHNLNLPSENKLLQLYFNSEPFSKRDRLSAHLATIMATRHNYAPGTIREKIQATSLLPSTYQGPRPSELPLTSMVISGYAKDYHPAKKTRMALFGNLEEIFYKPFENLPPTDLLPRLVRNFSRIMRVGLLRGGEGLFQPGRTEYLDRFINIACMHIDGIYIRDTTNDNSLVSKINKLLIDLKNGVIKYWGFNLSHSKTDQAGIGFRLDLTPGNKKLPILYDTLDMLRLRHLDGETLTLEQPLFGFRSCSDGTTACTLVLSYDIFLEFDKMLCTRFHDPSYHIRPHSRRSGFTSEMLRLNVPVHKIKVLLRHSNGAIDKYISMPPLEKVRIQNLTLNRRFVSLKPPTSAERKAISAILVVTPSLTNSQPLQKPYNQFEDDDSDQKSEETKEVVCLLFLIFSSYITPPTLGKRIRYVDMI